MENNQQFLIALGGNMPSDAGTPLETLRAALSMLAQSGASVDAASRFFRTPCFPPGAGPEYVNAAACISFGGTAASLLGLLHDIEAEYGRERVQRWGRRTLDLDLIAAGSDVLPDIETYNKWRELPPELQTKRAPNQLILPHPRLQDRPFVLVPLADIAPDWHHPVLNLSVTQMLASLPDTEKAEVVAL